MREAMLGIDPGKNGYLCLVAMDNGEILSSVKMPETAKELQEGLRFWQRQVNFEIVLEQAHAGSSSGRTQGVKSMFEYGRGFGKLEAVIECLCIPVQYVHPRTWTALLHKGIKGDNSKAKSLKLALDLAPGEAFIAPRGRKPHDGYIDAFLIARWAIWTRNGVPAKISTKGE